MKNTNTVKPDSPVEPAGEEVNRVKKVEASIKAESLFAEPSTSALPKMPTPEELWVDPEEMAHGTAVKQIITVIPIRKPEPHEFFRTHPDPIWEKQLVVVENRNEKKDAIYIVKPGVSSRLGELGIKYKMTFLFPTITLQQSFFFTPITVPGWDGRTNEWSTTGYDAAQRAKTVWVKRVAANGLYNIFEAEDYHPDPKWPENMSPGFLYNIAFRDGRIIHDLDHPVLKQLRGASFAG
jgi:hypothetical protein